MANPYVYSNPPFSLNAGTRELSIVCGAATENATLTSGYVSWGDGTSNTNFSSGDLAAMTNDPVTKTHTYATPGTYTVTIHVEDSDTQTAEQSINIAQSTAPTVQMSYDYTAPVDGFYRAGDCRAMFSYLENTTFYYTLDGSTPTTSSTQWDTYGIFFNATTTLKVIAVTSQSFASSVTTESVQVARTPTISLGTPTITGLAVSVVATITSPDLPITSGSLYWGGQSASLTAGQLVTINADNALTLALTGPGTGSHSLSIGIADAFTYTDANTTIEVTHPLLATVGRTLSLVDTITAPELNWLAISDIVVHPESGLVYVALYDPQSYSNHARVVAIDRQTDTVVATASYATSGQYRPPSIGIDEDGNILLVVYTTYNSGQWYDTYYVTYAPNLTPIATAPINSPYGYRIDDRISTLSTGTSYVFAGGIVHPAGTLTADQPGSLYSIAWFSDTQCAVFSIDAPGEYADGWLGFYNYANGALTRTRLVQTHNDSYMYSGKLVMTGTTPATMVLLTSHNGWSEVKRYDEQGYYIGTSTWCEAWGDGYFYAQTATGYDIYAPTGIDVPVVTLAEHAGWTGATLQVDVSATCDTESALVRVSATWGDGSSTTDTTALSEYADGETLSHVYTGAGLYQPTAATADIYGFVSRATVPERINVGSYTLAGNVTDDAVAGTFTVTTGNGGITQIALNAAGRAKLQYCIDNNQAFHLGIQLDSTLEDEGYAAFNTSSMSPPILSINGGTLSLSAVLLNGYYGRVMSKYVTGTGITDDQWSTLAIGKYPYEPRTARSLMQFATPTTWATVSSASLTLTNSYEPTSGALTGRVTIFTTNAMLSLPPESYYRIGLEQAPVDAVQDNITAWHVVDTVTLPVDAPGGSTYTVALDATALQKLNHCRQQAIPFYLGLTLAPDFAFSPGAAGEQGAYFDHIVLSVNGGEETTNARYGHTVFECSGESNSYNSWGNYDQYMAVFSQAENGGAQHAYRLLFGHTATHLALTASVTFTLGWLNGSPVKPVPVQLVVMPANDFPTAYDGFRLIGNDCLWPSIAPFNTALQAPYTITLSSPTSDPIYYTTDGSTPTAASTVYSDAIDIETAGATVVKAITIDSAGRVSYPRTSTINGMSLSLGAPVITHRVVEIALTGSSPVPFTEGSFYWGDSSVSLTSEQLTALQSGSITLTHTYIGSGVYDLSVSVYDAGQHGAYDSLDDMAVTHELAYPMEVAETLTPFAWANGGIMDIATNADQSLIYVVRSTDSYSSDLYAITPAGTIVHQTSWSRSGGGNSDQLWVDDDGFVIVDLYDNGYKTRRYTPNLSSYTTIATDVRYAHGRADGELVAVDNIAVADDTHLIRTDGSTLRILVDGVEIATKYLENSYQYGLSFARTGNMVAVLRSFPGYSARIVDRYDVDTGGFIDAVELPWPSEPYAMHCAGGKMYLGYGSETIVIYAPTDIAAPTLTFAEVAGWTGRTLEMRAVATVDAASDPFRAAVAWGDDSTTVTTDAGQLATLCTGPAGRVYSHTYATGVYTKVRASVEDTYGLQAHVTTAWIDVDYTFTENITADAVGGVFTFPTAGAVTVTLNALALQKLNWAREHGIGLAVGVKVAVSHEYTRYVNLTGANPSLTLNAADVVSVDSWTSYSRTNATGAFNSWSGGWSSHGTYNDQALVRSAVEFDAFELYVPITGATVTLVVDSAEIEGMTGHLVVFVDDEFTDSTDEEWWLRIGLPSPTIAVSTTTLDRVATVTVTIGGSAAADASGLSVTWGDGASTALGAMLLDELQAGDPTPFGHPYAGDGWYRVGVLVATSAGGGAYWSRSLRAQQGVPELTSGDYYRSVAIAGTGEARRTYMALRLASESGYVVIADDDDHFCGTLGVPTGQVGDRVFGSAGPGRIVPHPADPTRIYVEDGIISSSSWACIFHDGAFERAIPGTDLSQYAWDVTNDGSVIATSPSWNYVLKTNATNTASVTISPSSWNGSTMGVAYDAGTDSMWVMGQDYLFRMTDDGVVHEQISGWFGRAQIVDGVLYAQRGSESSIAKYVLNGTVALSTLTMTPTICDAYASNYNPAGGRNWFYVADGTLYWVDFDAGNAATYGHVNELATLPATVNCYLHPTAATGLDTYVAAVPAHVMLLGEGIDGATTILDEGGRTVTVVGTVHIENTAGDQSIVFDGSSHLTMDGADFHLQGGNWTIALQVKPDAVAQCLLLSLRPYLDGYAPILLFINNGYLSLYMSSDNASWLNSDTSTGTQSIPTGSWTGIEICRNGTAFTVRVNGVTDLTWSSSASLANAASTIAIGGGYAWDYSMGFLGRMRKIFVAKDVVLHTADFDPATVTYPTGGTPASGTPGWLRHVAADIEGTPESVAGATANYWKHLNLTNMHGEPRANIARTWTNTAENGGDAYAGLQVQGALPLEVTFGELPEGALPVSVNVVGFFPGFTTRAYYDGGGWGYWYDSYAAGQFVLSAREQLPGATAVVSSALTDTASTTYNPTTWTLATAPGGASWSNTTVNALRVKVTPDAGAPTVRSAGMMLAVSLLAGTAAPTGTFVLTEEDEVTGTVTCLLTASDDDGDIVRVVVQWGDGQTSTYTAAADLAAITSPGGMTITHVYAGTYTATATIVDAAEHLTTLTLVPAEDNVAPGAEVTSVAPMAAPNTRYIHATVSATDPDGNLDHVTVHWSDTESTTYTDADVPGHTDHASWFFDAWHTYTEDLYPYGGTFGIYAVAVDTNDVETVPGGIVLYSFTVTDLLPDLALVVTPQGDDAYTISCTPSDYDNPGWGEAQTVTLYPSWGDLATYPLDGNAPGPAATVALMLANNFTATVDYAPYPAGVHNLVAEVTAENGIVVRTLAEIERAEPPVVEIVSLVAGPHTRRYTATLRATDPDDNLDALTLQWAPGVIDTITLTTESRAALAAGTHTAAHTYSETDHPTGGTFTVTLTGTDALDATGTDTDEVTITDVLPEIGLAALLASGNSYHVTCAPADADNSTWDATATVTLYHSWGDFGTYPLSGSVPPGMTTTSVDAGDDFAADLTYTAGTHHLVAEVTAENGTVVRETVTITHAIPPAAFITAIVPNQSNGREVVATIGATDADDNLASLTIQWDTGITDTIAYADLSLMARAQLALGTYPRTHTYSETAYPFGGTFGVFVTATDTLGATTPPEEIATVTITITDEAPTLALTATKTGVSTYTIACVPTDHDNPAWNTSAVVTVYLSWGDLTTYPLDGPVPDGIGGVTLTSAQSFSMSIDYVNEPHGAITIVGEVTSENGTVVRAATEISHDNAAPTLSASASRLGPTSVRLSYTATDSDGTVTAIEYDHGDGTWHAATITPGASVSGTIDVSYTQPGTFTPRLRAQDNDGAWSAVTSTTHFTIDATPTVTLAALSVVGRRVMVRVNVTPRLLPVTVMELRFVDDYDQAVYTLAGEDITSGLDPFSYDFADYTFTTLLPPEGVTGTLYAYAYTAANGIYGTCSFDLTVNNASPVVTGGAVTMVNDDTTAAFSLSATDADGTVAAVEYDAGDGEWVDLDITPGATVEMVVNHTYTIAGSYNLRARARDNDGLWSAPVTLSPSAVVDTSPRVTLVGDATPGARTVALTLRARAVVPARSITSLYINWWDGAEEEILVSGLSPAEQAALGTTGVTFSHSAAGVPHAGGIASTYVLATDSALETGVYLHVVIFVNTTPVIQAEEIVLAPDNRSATVTVAISDPDYPAWNPSQWRYYLAWPYDGLYTPDVPANVSLTADGTVTGSLTTTLSYPDHGEYAPVLEVIDAGGAPGRTRLTLSLLNDAPSVGLAVVLVNQLAVTVLPTASDADGTLASVTLDWGDGTTLTPTLGANASHTYAADGTYTVTLTAIDDHGSTTSVTEELTVAATPNVPPTCALALVSIIP